MKISWKAQPVAPVVQVAVNALYYIIMLLDVEMLCAYVHTLGNGKELLNEMMEALSNMVNLVH